MSMAHESRSHQGFMDAREIRGAIEGGDVVRNMYIVPLNDPDYAKGFCAPFGYGMDEMGQVPVAIGRLTTQVFEPKVQVIIDKIDSKEDVPSGISKRSFPIPGIIISLNAKY